MPDVLTTAQAIETYGRAAVRRHLRAGTWQRPARGVIVTHNGPLSPDQHERAILAACPPGAALGGLTAARRLGFADFPPDRVHVVLPSGAKEPDLDAVFHWSTMRRARRARAPRSSRDDARAQHRRRRQLVGVEVPGAPAGACRVPTATDLGGTDARRASRRGPCRHRGVIIESTLDARGGIQSLPERDFEAIRVLAGLPRPERQAPMKGPEGRYYLDAWIPELNLAIEVHGIPHLSVRNWSDDLHRLNEIVIDGRRTLAFSSFAIRHERALVVDQLRRAAGLTPIEVVAPRPISGPGHHKIGSARGPKVESSVPRGPDTLGR